MISFKIALLAYIPLVMILFSLMPARRAVLYSVFGGMLFLPEASGIKIPLLTYSKLSAVSLATLLGVIAFDSSRLMAFRFRWFDTFWLLICFSAALTSVENGLGLYDGLAECSGAIFIWGIPYFLGRIYLTDLAALREAAIALFIGGLVYAPLCLWEIRMSPQLHRFVYGFYQHQFAQTIRLGGYRPIVFLQHGLAVGLFMSCATLAGFWLWRSGSLKMLWGMRTGSLTVFLLITTILCKSSGGIVLLGLGGLTLWAIRQYRSPWPLIILTMMPVTYMVIRGSGYFDGRALVGAATMVFGEDRAASLKTRIDAENLLARKALQRPAFGWGGWGRSRVFDESGHDVAVTDGMWIITLGKKGIVGVTALYGAFLIGPLLLKRRYDPAFWMHPMVAPAVVLSVVVVLHMIDALPNGMPSAIYYLIGGGLAGLGAQVPQTSQARGFPVQTAMAQQRQPAAMGH